MARLGESLVYSAERSFSQGAAATVGSVLRALISGYYAKTYIFGHITTEFSATGNVVVGSHLTGLFSLEQGTIVLEENDSSYHNKLDGLTNYHVIASNLPFVFPIPVYQNMNFVAEIGHSYKISQNEQLKVNNTVVETGIMNQGVCKFVTQTEVYS